MGVGFDHLVLDHIISIIHRENVASRRVAEKLGMALWREQEFDHPDAGKPAMPIVVYRIERGRSRSSDCRD